jgi:hypothetical protein
VNEIYENTTIGYPSYSRRDDKILFTYDDFGTLLLATIGVQASDKTLPVNGTDVVLITGAQKGVWFQTGTRVISATDGVLLTAAKIYPQPAYDILHVTTEDNIAATEFRIQDIHGKEILKGSVISGTIDIQKLPAGVYTLQLQGDHAFSPTMIVKM